VRLHPTGATRWLRRLDRNGDTEHGADVVQAADGNFLVAGYTTNIATWYDAYLAKLRDGPVSATAPGSEFTWRVRVQPNPFATVARFQVDQGDPPPPYRFRLFDAAGRCVRALAVTTSRFDLERGSLAAGTYYYELRPQRGNAARGKISIR
jgi:hypothetical protein